MVQLLKSAEAAQFTSAAMQQTWRHRQHSMYERGMACYIIEPDCCTMRL
jgi:hypothetical protein